ncbi:MAG: HigA family addiction module antitoxin [Geminicoccaceae bacterium]
MRTTIHPGEILADELKERGMTYAELAKAMQVPETHVSQIVAGKQDITPAIAQHLSQCLGTSAEFWTNLQSTYELDRARAALRADIQVGLNDIADGRVEDFDAETITNSTKNR